ALAGLCAFEAEQTGLLAGAEAGDIEVVPGTGGDGVGQTEVYTDDSAGDRAGDGRLGGGERDVPAAGPVPGHSGHAVLPEGTGEAKVDPADLGDVYLRPLAGDPPHLDVADAEP